MQAALLRAELYQIHNQLRDAHATLVSALKVTDSKGVASLRSKIGRKIDEIELLLSENTTSDT
jgi:hypothetical protein